MEKNFLAKNKVRFALLTLIAVVGIILPLAIMGKIEVTSEQIFSFGQWFFGLFAAAHATQRGTSYIAQAIKSPTPNSEEHTDE